MTSSFDRYSMANRRLAYSPVVADDRPGGYSAKELNRIIMDVEQTFETCLRQTEDQLNKARGALELRQEELATLANLADRRSAAAEAELTKRAADLETQDRLLTERDAALADIRAERDHLIATARQAAAAATAKEVKMARDIATLEETLNQMKQSRSWRLTRPLRWLSRSSGRG